MKISNINYDYRKNENFAGCKEIATNNNQFCQTQNLNIQSNLSFGKSRHATTALVALGIIALIHSAFPQLSKDDMKTSNAQNASITDTFNIAKSNSYIEKSAIKVPEFIKNLGNYAKNVNEASQENAKKQVEELIKTSERFAKH